MWHSCWILVGISRQISLVHLLTTHCLWTINCKTKYQKQAGKPAGCVECLICSVSVWNLWLWSLLVLGFVLHLVNALLAIRAHGDFEKKNEFYIDKQLNDWLELKDGVTTGCHWKYSSAKNYYTTCYWNTKPQRGDIAFMPVILYGASLLLKTFPSPFFQQFEWLIDTGKKGEKRESEKER